MKKDSKLEIKSINANAKLLAYPVDMSWGSTQSTRDPTGMPYCGPAKVNHPTTIIQCALAHWNVFLATSEEGYRQAFLTQVNWLVEHEVRIARDAGGWPVYAPHTNIHIRSPWLSSFTQGCAISVLTRAYLLTREEIFLEVLQRVVRTFERDILDGGVNTPIGKDGVFFEEIAIYPATHGLKGFLFGLLGLYDYVELVSDSAIEALISRSLVTLHNFLHEFDKGFWTCSDLLYRYLSSHAELATQAALLDAVAKYSGCSHCTNLASRWRSYQQHLRSRLRYLVTTNYIRLKRILWSQIRSTLLGRKNLLAHQKLEQKGGLRICIPITAFPVAGGMRSVLLRIEQVTKDIWQREYLTQYIGPNADEFVIHRFGTKKMTPWQFPVVWLYVLAGFWKLVSLLRAGVDYDMILLQDGVYTAAFGALAAKMAGIRVVCMDHGNLSLLKSQAFRSERLKAIEEKNWSWLHKRLARFLYVWYWPSLVFFARLGARFVDDYCIPGVIGDGVEEICRSLGIQPGRITRFANMVEVERHIIPDAAQRAEIRRRYGINEDAIVIAIICRLAPEKGLEIALEGICLALAALPLELAERLRVIIAGDGPLRQQLEEEIHQRRLEQTCLLWGEASTEEVITILGVSDIFLFTSWRAAGYPLAVLEAMASGCAIIAATDSLANQEMLAEGRGIVLSAGDARGTGKAITQLASDSELRFQMGSLARNYVMTKHSVNTFRRSLMRLTYWSSLDEILHSETENKKNGQVGL